MRATEIEPVCFLIWALHQRSPFLIITAAGARFYLILRAQNKQETFNMWELFPNLAAPYEIFGEEETQIKLQ